MVPTFQGNFLLLKKERLVWAGRRQWNAVNSWGRPFTRAGSAVKEVKGEPIHLIQGPWKWTCELSHSQDWTTWFLMHRLLTPRFLYLGFLCNEIYLCPNRDTINIKPLTACFLPSFDRTDHTLTCNSKSQLPKLFYSCFVFNRSNTSMTHFQFYLLWSFKVWGIKCFNFKNYSCYIVRAALAS